MIPERRRGLVLLSCAAALLAPVRPARGAALDLSLEYRARALSYRNLELDPALKSADAFFSERARVGFLVKKIALETGSGAESSMEVGLAMQALNIAGSTAPFSGPVARAASRYPRTDFTPFIESAYLRIFNPVGWLGELTVGRQPARLGSGLVLSDDGLGFTGVSAKKAMASWGGQAFYFQPRAAGTSAADKLHVAGIALDFALDGTLSLSEVLESDHTGAVEAGIPLKSATRHFLGAHYRVRTDQFAFEGEAVLQRGSATPQAPGLSRIPYRGAAASMTGLWRQDLGRWGSGTARLSAAEGTGDNPATAGRNEGFFPSFGHRFDGLERDGWGDFFGASLYDAIGPSTTTANGLPAGLSGIRVVRLGMSPPAHRGVMLDLDYYLFEAAQAPASRDLGKEFDVRLSYPIKDRLLLRASAAFFNAGKALNIKSTSASRFALEISGRF